MSTPTQVYTWLFVRGDEQLRIMRPTPLKLVVSSPSADDRTFDFKDPVALLEFQLEFEANLIQTGWHLDSFSPERRSGQDRRKTSRPGTPDRRHR